MNTQRITVGPQNYLYEEFVALREKLPKKEKTQILKAIKKGRL